MIDLTMGKPQPSTIALALPKTDSPAVERDEKLLADPPGNPLAGFSDN